jgi:type II secretory pathway pseudopilin PulG
MEKGNPMREQSSIIDHQSSMRSGFTLIEVLMIVVIAPFILVVVSGLFGTFIRDIPQGTRLVQQNTTVLHMLDQLRRDVGDAVALPQQTAGAHADETTLRIEQPEGVVLYRFEAGRTVREVITGQEQASERIWQARDAVIEWEPWTQEGATVGVEVRSHIRQQVAGIVLHKLPGSHVFFMAGPGERSAIR